MRGAPEDNALLRAGIEAQEFLNLEWDSERRKPKSGSWNRWFEKVFEEGWAVPTWAEQWWGRGLSREEAKCAVRAFRRVGAPGSGQDQSSIPAITLFQFGNDNIKRKLIPGFLKGQLKPCLLYSEPGAGSDLASVQTRADHVNDKYVIKGQKVWTSGAQTADYGLLLARTNWEVPKHKGLSFFFLDMKQSGVEVRPIHQITGDSHFNEVFLDGAKVGTENLIGQEGEGWKVLQVALAVERQIMGGGAAERRQGETANEKRTLVELAREVDKLQEAHFRQELAKVIAYRRLNELNQKRFRDDIAKGASPSLLSLGKLAMSRVLHEEARVMTALLGPQSIFDGKMNTDASDANFRTANAYMTSIGGGTDQILKNIIGEHLLGLPRETDPDRNTPFKDSLAVRRSSR
ncbi:MAG: acyl-CoA dehydrogenase family protein [Parvibaculaceae bacterium]